MLELSNQGPWSAGLYPGFQLNQEFQWTCVIKASFEFDDKGTLSPLQEQPAIEETDQHYGKPLETSLEVANEIAPFKSGSEIYLYGTAVSQVKDARMMEVTLGIRFANGEDWQKTLRIFGQRQWKGTRFTPLISSPEIIENVPLRYEYAYGGIDPDNEQNEYDQNRAGKGYVSDPLKAIGQSLPQIEIGPKFIKSPNTKASPACFAPIPAFWSPRKENAGTLDEESAKLGLCPFTDELKPCFYNAAPPDQRFKIALQGGEVITLTGLLPEMPPAKPFALELPKLNHEVWQITGQKQQKIEPKCDTVVIDTDRRILNMIWRAGIPWSRTEYKKGWIILTDDREYGLGTNAATEASL